MRHALLRSGPAVAFACLAASSACVHAQSSVKVYGILDAGVEYNGSGAPFVRGCTKHTTSLPVPSFAVSTASSRRPTKDAVSLRHA